jgi:hypothetical protein
MQQQQQPVQSSPTQSGWQTPQTSSTGQSDWQQPGSTGTATGSTPLLGEVLQQEQRGGTPPPANTMAPMGTGSSVPMSPASVIGGALSGGTGGGSIQLPGLPPIDPAQAAGAMQFLMQIMPQGGGGGLGAFKGGFPTPNGGGGGQVFMNRGGGKPPNVVSRTANYAGKVTEGATRRAINVGVNGAVNRTLYQGLSKIRF